MATARSFLQLIQVKTIAMPALVLILHVLIIRVHLWRHIHHLKLNLTSLQNNRIK